MSPDNDAALYNSFITIVVTVINLSMVASRYGHYDRDTFRHALADLGLFRGVDFGNPRT